MSELDETDLEILELLAEDARRPYSEIGERVGLSGPAVSARVDRLAESGVVRRFTVDVDRSTLDAGIPVLVSATVPPGRLAAVRESLRGNDDVEYVFVTAGGDLVFFARVRAAHVGPWVRDLLVEEASYEVTLVDEAEWTPTVGGNGAGFALTCDECGNTVTEEGERARIDGQLYHFCCPSCHANFAERYERFSERAD